ADDLIRFIEGRLIQARAVSSVERTWRWVRRKPTAAALMATALALVVMLIVGGMFVIQRRVERDAELRSAITTAVSQAVGHRKRCQFQKAHELLDLAQQRLEPAGPDDLRRQVRQARADVELAEGIDSAQNRATWPGIAAYDFVGIDQSCL